MMTFESVQSSCTQQNINSCSTLLSPLAPFKRDYNKSTVIGSQVRLVAALRHHHHNNNQSDNNNMVEVSAEGELARAAARASDGGPVSGSNERGGSEGGSQQQNSPPTSLSNGPTNTTSSPATTPANHQQSSPNTGHSPSPSVTPQSSSVQPHHHHEDRNTPVVEESSEQATQVTRQHEPPPLAPVSSVNSPDQQRVSSETPSSPRNSTGSAVPPPLVRSRHSTPTSVPSGVGGLNYPRQLGAVSERVSTMANNASGAFDSGVQRLHHQQRTSVAPKLIENNNNNLKSSPSLQQLQPPPRQPTAPAPVPAPHPTHQRLSQQQQQQAYKQPMPHLQKPVRPLPMRAYNTTPSDHQNLTRDSVLNKSTSQQQQRPSFNSPPSQQDVRDLFLSSNHHSTGNATEPPRTSIRSLEELSQKVVVERPSMSAIERTRNGASIQEVTRELSDLVRFPNSGGPVTLRPRALPPNELRQHQQMQLNAAADDVERYTKEYERAQQEFVNARERLNRAQQVLEHHKSLAEAMAALQAEQRQRLQEQRQQEQHAALTQPTLANLLLSDPPQKRMRLEHPSPPTAPSQQPLHSSPPTAPPAPQHLMSPQLPQPRNGRNSNERSSNNETPMDLSNARPTWQPPTQQQPLVQHSSIEELWRAASSPNNTAAPPFSIRILTPPEVIPIPVNPVPPTANSRPDPQFFLRHKLKYRPLVDPVSPPRPPERTPSPQLVLSRPTGGLQPQSPPAEVLHVQPREHMTASPQQHERIRILHPGGAVLHQRPLVNNQSQQPPPQQQQQQQQGQIQMPRRQSKAHCLRCLRTSGYVCSSCKLATYCSTECQTQHWSEHEQECMRICQLTKNMKSGRPYQHQ